MNITQKAREIAGKLFVARYDADDSILDSYVSGLADVDDDVIAAQAALDEAAPLVEALRKIEDIDMDPTLGPDHNLERARNIAREALAKWGDGE